MVSEKPKRIETKLKPLIAKRAPNCFAGTSNPCAILAKRVADLLWSEELQKIEAEGTVLLAQKHYKMG